MFIRLTSLPSLHYKSFIVYSLMQQNTTLPGDILLVCAFISYVGCFTKQYRLDLLHKNWLVFMKTLEVKLNLTSLEKSTNLII